MRTFSTFVRCAWQMGSVTRTTKANICVMRAYILCIKSYRKTKFKYQILVMRTEQCLTFNRLPFDVYYVWIDKWCMTIEGDRTVNVTCLIRYQHQDSCVAQPLLWFSPFFHSHTVPCANKSNSFPHTKHNPSFVIMIIITSTREHMMR